MADASPDVIRRLGKYEVLTRLSVGGMGELFLAYASGPGGFRKFATIKRIRPEIRTNETFLAMFLEEARLTAAMSHASIAQVFELGQQDDDYFLAMEFIPGQDLRQVAKACAAQHRRIPLGFVAMALRDACLALHYAHHFKDAAGRPSPIVHLDVSPKNIMVTYEGSVKVIDFGISKVRGHMSSTPDGTVVGTTQYMSPEQLLSEPVDGRADLFSMGTIFHELVTMKRLFIAETETQSMLKILQHPIPRPEEVLPGVPAAVSDVVMRALQRRVSDRFNTAREMARAIEGAVGGELFDEERAGAFMRELFGSQLAQTQALFAVSVAAEDSGPLQEAAGAFRGAGDSGSTSSKVRRMEEADDIATHTLSGLTQSHVGPVDRSVPTVMVVDDSATSISFVRVALAAINCRVVGVGSPLLALSTFETEQPDLVILDVMMPEMDGFEVCRRIREANPHRWLPILFLSGACSLEERVRGLTVGGDDFMRKPADREELVARVRVHLQRAASLKAALRPREPLGG